MIFASISFCVLMRVCLGFSIHGQPFVWWLFIDGWECYSEDDPDVPLRISEFKNSNCGAERVSNGSYLVWVVRLRI